jgi:hypothetical protein
MPEKKEIISNNSLSDIMGERPAWLIRNGLFLFLMFTIVFLSLFKVITYTSYLTITLFPAHSDNVDYAGNLTGAKWTGTLLPSQGKQVATGEAVRLSRLDTYHNVSSITGKVDTLLYNKAIGNYTVVVSVSADEGIDSLWRSRSTISQVTGIIPYSSDFFHLIFQKIKPGLPSRAH